LALIGPFTEGEEGTSHDTGSDNKTQPTNQTKSPIIIYNQA